MKVLLTGASGQLGQELILSCPSSLNLKTLTRQEFDITNSELVTAEIESFMPEVIINAAAFTAVDAAEDNVLLAQNVNANGVAHLATAARNQQCYFIHLSTDYIFDGTKSSPYLTDDKANPINQYGLSKWLGEEKILEIYPDRSLILRSSWIYSAFGKNFVKTMLNLMQTKNELRVIADQRGTPTSAKNLAKMIWHIIQNKQVNGIYHWTDEGVASWYEFAVAIQEEALAKKILHKHIPVYAISTEDFSSVAKRPAYSVLDKTKSYEEFGMIAQDWRVALREMLSCWK